MRSSSDVTVPPEALIWSSKALISFCSVFVRAPELFGFRISICLLSSSCCKFKGTFGFWGGGVAASAASADGCC